MTVCHQCGASFACARGRRGPWPTRCERCRRRPRGLHSMTCEECGFPFAGRRDRRFCSVACSGAFNLRTTGAWRTCEWCQTIFRGPRQGRAARRFCSKKCSANHQFAPRRAAIQAAAQAAALERQINQELRRIQKQTCPCGARIERPTARWCRACYAKRIRDGIRQGLARVRDKGYSHLCPNCGRGFCGYPSAVFCSSRCRRQYPRERYPAIRDVSLAERNQIAELIALARSANRRIQQPLTD